MTSDEHPPRGARLAGRLVNTAGREVPYALQTLWQVSPPFRGHSLIRLTMDWGPGVALVHSCVDDSPSLFEADIGRNTTPGVILRGLGYPLILVDLNKLNPVASSSLNTIFKDAYRKNNPTTDPKCRDQQLQAQSLASPWLSLSWPSPSVSVCSWGGILASTHFG